MKSRQSALESNLALSVALQTLLVTAFAWGYVRHASLSAVNAGVGVFMAPPLERFTLQELCRWSRRCVNDEYSHYANHICRCFPRFAPWANSRRHAVTLYAKRSHGSGDVRPLNEPAPPHPADELPLLAESRLRLACDSLLWVQTVDRAAQPRPRNAKRSTLRHCYFRLGDSPRPSGCRRIRSFSPPGRAFLVPGRAACPHRAHHDWLRSWTSNRTTSLPSRALSRFSGVSLPSAVPATNR